MLQHNALKTVMWKCSSIHCCTISKTQLLCLRVPKLHMSFLLVTAVLR